MSKHTYEVTGQSHTYEVTNGEDGSTGPRPRYSASALLFRVLQVLTGNMRQEIQRD